MKTTMSSQLKYIVLIIFISSVFASCKKQSDAKLPDISFKTGGNYTSANGTVNKSEILTVGIITDKNEDDLRTFKVYYAYGNDPVTLKNTYNLTDSEKDHYEKDYKITTQNAYGSETWKFEIADKGGNTNSLTLVFSVR